MVRAQDERLYDEYDRMAASAMMQRKATDAKRLKQSDLFKRPIDGNAAEEKMLGFKDKAENATDWLSQFSNFRG